MDSRAATGSPGGGGLATRRARALLDSAGLENAEQEGSDPLGPVRRLGRSLANCGGRRALKQEEEVCRADLVQPRFAQELGEPALEALLVRRRGAVRVA